MIYPVQFENRWLMVYICWLESWTLQTDKTHQHLHIQVGYIKGQQMWAARVSYGFMVVRFHIRSSAKVSEGWSFVPLQFVCVDLPLNDR